MIQICEVDEGIIKKKKTGIGSARFHCVALVCVTLVVRANAAPTSSLYNLKEAEMKNINRERALNKPRATSVLQGHRMKTVTLEELLVFLQGELTSASCNLATRCH